MAGERIFTARYAKHPTVAITGVTHARIVRSTTDKVDQGAAGATGRADGLVTDNDCRVELYGKSYAALLALIGATKANLVIGTEGSAGTNEKCTLKNVYFLEPIGPVDIPAKDGGGNLSVVGVRGIALWGGADTWALMEVWAADS